MIIDAELAVMAYLETNLPGVVITRRKFYDDTPPSAVSVAVEDGDGPDIPGLVAVTVRINVRAPRGSEAFALMQSVDGHLDRQIRKMLNDDTECLGCSRNVHPQPLDGTNGLRHYTCLYDMLLRRRA